MSWYRLTSKRTEIGGVFGLKGKTIIGEDPCVTVSSHLVVSESAEPTYIIAWGPPCTGHIRYTASTSNPAWSVVTSLVYTLFKGTRLNGQAWDLNSTPRSI